MVLQDDGLWLIRKLTSYAVRSAIKAQLRWNFCTVLSKLPLASLLRTHWEGTLIIPTSSNVAKFLRSSSWAAPMVPKFYINFRTLMYSVTRERKESWATAKMTARCAIYMGALKIFESPWIRPRLLLPKFLMGFCSDRSVNVRTKFKVWSS